MKKITPADVIDIYEYDRQRDQYVRAYQQAKRGRFYNLGPTLLVHFHTFDTVLFQLQEFLRGQRIRDDGEIRSHLHTYNSLIPEDGHLMATLQVDFSRNDDIQELLRLPQRVADNHLQIIAGKSVSVTGTPQSNDKSPVSFVDFSLPDEFIRKLSEETSDLKLYSNLPSYEHSLFLDSEGQQAMVADLA